MIFSQIKHLIIQILRKMVGYPWLIITGILAISFFFFGQIKEQMLTPEGKLIIDSSLNHYLDQESESFDFFNEMRRTFGNEDVMIIAVQPPFNQNFNLAFFQKIDQLTQDIPKRVPGILKVHSLTNTPQISGSCAGQSYFRQETFGSICESILKKYEHDVRCLSQPSPSIIPLSPLNLEEEPEFNLEEEPEFLVEDVAEDSPLADVAEDSPLALDSAETSQPTDFEEKPEFSGESVAGIDANGHNGDSDEYGWICDPKTHQKTMDQLRDEVEYKISLVLEKLKQAPFIQKDLISDDFKTAALIIRFQSEIDTATSEIQQPLAEILNELKREKYIAASAGLSRRQYEASVTLDRDIQKILPLSFVFMTVIWIFSFRTILGVVIPSIVVGLGLLWTFGVFSMFGGVLNPVTAILPALFICVGSAYILFSLNQFYQEAHKSQDRKLVINNTIANLVVPLGVTALTTVAGFAALISSPIPAIKTMGIYACIGVTSVVFLSLTFVPSVLSLIKLPESAPTIAWPGPLDKFLSWLSSLIGKYPRQFILVWVGIGLAGFIGLIQIEIDSDTTAFSEDKPVMRDLRFIETNLAGTSNLRLIFSSPLDPARLQTVQTIKGIAKLQQALLNKNTNHPIQQIQGLRIDKVYSVVNYLRQQYPDLDEGLTDRGVQLFFRKIRSHNSLVFLNKDESLMQMTIRMKSEGSATLIALQDLLNKLIPEYLPGLQVRYTGGEVLASEAANNISKGQIRSVTLALVVIFLILSLLFLSLKMGLIALYPNIVTIFVFFGILGWFSIPLGITISVIAAIALGIGVDDTIHFLAHYSKNVKLLRNEQQASELTVRQIGRPVTFTTLSLAFGFGLFMISDMETQVLFGVLIAFTLIICWLADMNFLPSITVNTKLITAWDYAELDYNPAYLNGIPMFEGMSVRETKLATLMGYPIALEPDMILFREGQIGRELYILLEGEIELYWDKQFHDEEKVFSVLTKGDTFGFVDLFSQTVGNTERTTSARAIKPTKLLALNDNVLSNLQRRYPVIATKLYMNLSSNLFNILLLSDIQFVDKIKSHASVEAHLQNIHPTEEEIKSIVEEIIEDGVFTPSEREKLEQLINSNPLITDIGNEHMNRLEYLIEKGQVIEIKLVSVDIFHNVSFWQLKWLKKRFPVRRYRSGETIWNEGDEGHSMLFILQGRLKVTHQEKDHIVPIRTVSKGSIVGEKTVLFDNVAHDNVVALDETEVLEISLEGFEKMMAKDKWLAAQIAHNLVALLANRLQETIDKLYS